MTSLQRNGVHFFQLAFFRCHARRRPDWSVIEVEVTAGDLCCTFHFEPGTSIEELKTGTARKLLVVLQGHTEWIQDIIDRN